jgi:DNA-binding winged helix-turn-helix (wHTH) protein/tetratricopeptide (TPR) repeat protein
LGRLVRVGPATVDLERGEVSCGDQRHRLTPLEAELLGYLWARAGQVVPREELLREVWRYHPGTMTRAVDHLVFRLRRKIGDEGAAYLCSIYGEGYALVRAEPGDSVLERVTTSSWELPSPSERRSLLESYVARGQRLRQEGARGSGGLPGEGVALLGQLRAAWGWVHTTDPVLAAQAAAIIAWLALAHGPSHDLGALLEEALEGTLPEELRLVLLRYRGEVHLLGRSAALARADLSLAAQASDVQVRCEALTLLSSLCVQLSELDEAALLLEQAISVGEEAGLVGHLPTLWVRRAMLWGRRGDLLGEERELVRAAELAKARVLPRAEGLACRMLAERAWRQGRLDEAQRWLERAVSVVSDVDLAMLVGNLAMVTLSRGRLEEGLELMRKHLQLHEELGDSPFLALANLGEACLFVGHLQEAEQRLHEAHAWAERFGAPARLGDLLARLGRCAQARGDRQRARELYEQADLRAVGPSRGQLAEFRADLAWEEGDLAAAAEGYTAALEALEAAGWRLGSAGLRAKLACVRFFAGARQDLAVSGLVPHEVRMVELAQALLTGERAAIDVREGDPLPVRFLVERLR